MNTAFRVWTLGHSNLSFDDFLERLECYEIGAIADVRRFPGSRRQPQYSKDTMPSALNDHAITYRWFEALGGRRRPAPNSSNTAWRNMSFRGYADYMESAAFGVAIEQLLTLAGEHRTALMCAEVLWWRCHRSLISDVLRLRGVQVIHILGLGKTVEHPFTSPARIVEGRLKYSR